MTIILKMSLNCRNLKVAVHILYSDCFSTGVEPSTETLPIPPDVVKITFIIELKCLPFCTFYIYISIIYT